MWFSLWLSLAAFGISLFSASFTLWKHCKDRQYADDKELLELLEQSIRLAYEAIATENGTPTNIPLRWRTSARHIVRYQSLKPSLKTKLYKTLCDEQEEYWRERFYALLQRITDRDFFTSINLDGMEKEYIELKAAAVVYSMSVWPQGKPEPHDDVNLESLVQDYNLWCQRLRGNAPKQA